jgi:hypothetical protein
LPAFGGDAIFGKHGAQQFELLFLEQTLVAFRVILPFRGQHADYRIICEVFLVHPR